MRQKANQDKLLKVKRRWENSPKSKPEMGMELLAIRTQLDLLIQTVTQKNRQIRKFLKLNGDKVPGCIGPGKLSHTKSSGAVVQKILAQAADELSNGVHYLECDFGADKARINRSRRKA